MTDDATFEFGVQDLAEKYDFEKGGTQTVFFRQGSYSMKVELNMEENPTSLLDAEFRIAAFHRGFEEIPFFHRHEDVLEPEMSEDYFAVTEPILTSGP